MRDGTIYKGYVSSGTVEAEVSLLLLPSAISSEQVSWQQHSGVQEPSDTEGSSTTELILMQPSCKTAVDWLKSVFLEGFDVFWYRNNELLQSTKIYSSKLIDTNILHCQALS